MIADWEVTGVFLADKLAGRHPQLYSLLRARLSDHGVEVRLLDNVRDIWARDYCPVQIGPRQFVKFRYDPDYLHDLPHLRTGPEVLGAYTDLGECVTSPIVLDGGNVVASRTTAIVTDKIYKENREWTRDDLRRDLQRVLNVERLIVVPMEPYDWIGHTDGMIRFVDEDTVLVNDYASLATNFGQKLMAVLTQHGLACELLPYFWDEQGPKGGESAVGCYMNFLRCRQLLIVPQFDHPSDSTATSRLKKVFPRLPIIPLACTDLAREGGLFNCVTASYCRADILG